MIIFPATDIIDGKVVRLLKGDYGKKTVYDITPLDAAREFKSCGAEYLHAVDLDGAKSGKCDNIDVIRLLAEKSDLKVEIGGGIRSEESVKKYIDAGVWRVILGTAAVKDPEFLKRTVDKYKEKIAVGADIKDGFVATDGWMEKSSITCFDFFEKMEQIGVKTIICTDISKDGAMQGTNHELYGELMNRFKIDITASGGVSSIDDVKRLKKSGIYGAIIGKALYNGAVDLKEAISAAKEEKR